MKRWIALGFLMISATIAAAQATPTPSVPCTFVIEGTNDVTVNFADRNEFVRVIGTLGIPGLLNCAARPEEFEVYAASPSVALNALLPRDTNTPESLAIQTAYGIVNKPFANIRSGDGAEYTRVGLATGGDELVLLGRNAESSWWYVQLGMLKGWMSASVIVLRGELADFPVVVTDGEIQQPVVVVPYTGNILYDGLQVTSGEACRIQGNQSYRVLGISFNDAFYLIEAICLDGTITEGWLAVDRGILRNPAGIRLMRIQG